MTTPRDLVIYAGQTFTLSLPYAGTAGRGQRYDGISSTSGSRSSTWVETRASC